MSRNAPAVVLAIFAALLLVAGSLLFRAYREADQERVALRGRVGTLEAEVSASRDRLSQLEANIATLTEETTRLHEQNQRLHQSGAADQK